VIVLRVEASSRSRFVSFESLQITKTFLTKRPIAIEQKKTKIHNAFDFERTSVAEIEGAEA
jgi:hypothetical protein